MNRLLFILLFFPCAIAFSQDMDSLISVAEQSEFDSTKARIYSDISEYCDVPDIPVFGILAIEYSDSAKKHGQESQLVYFSEAQAFNNLGYYYHFLTEYEKSVENYQKSVELFSAIPDSTGIGLALNNLAMVYDDKGDVKKALELLDKAHEISVSVDDFHIVNTTFTNISKINTHLGNYEKAIKYALLGLDIQERNDDKYGMGYSLNNIASLHFMQKDYGNAEKYMLESLELRLELGNMEEIGIAYGNLGVMYLDMEKDSLGIDYLYKAKQVREETQESEMLSKIYVQIGVYYMEYGILDSTQFYLLNALEISNEIGAPEVQASVRNHLGALYRKLGDLNKATQYGEESFKIANELGFPESIRNSAQTLSKIYADSKNYKAAYEMHFLYLEMRDSLDNDNNHHQLIQQEVNAQYEKKRFADSLDHAVEKQFSVLELEAANAEIEKTNTRNFALGIGIFMLLVLVVIALFAYRNKRKSANEISLKNIAIENQKLVVEEKNKEITDSINYAKRIQGAILPSSDVWKESLSESFVLYKPKDIVAGDFYWLEHKNDNVLFAAADCTGHGVPGAMVSVVCNNALNRSVREYGFIDPGKILDKTRDLVIQEFEKSDEDVKDGMDIALCSIKGKELYFSGANNPLWVIRKGEIIEIKPDKEPVGKFDRQTPYTSHIMSLETGDSIYIFSDGYIDQFGGEKGKKFKAKAFKNLLLSIQNKTMEEQKKSLDNAFETWRGTLEQIDDVCVIGVKV